MNHTEVKGKKVGKGLDQGPEEACGKRWQPSWTKSVDYKQNTQKFLRQQRLRMESYFEFYTSTSIPFYK